MRKVKLLSVTLGALFVVMSASAHLFAQEDVIKKRQERMQSNNADVKAIAGAAKKKDFATIEAKAKEIENNFDALAKLFPEGSTKGKTRAHKDIWAKPDEFKSHLADAKKAADALSKAAASKNEAEVEAKIKELGNPRAGACGACHKMFRTDQRKDG